MASLSSIDREALTIAQDPSMTPEQKKSALDTLYAAPAPVMPEQPDLRLANNTAVAPEDQGLAAWAGAQKQQGQDQVLTDTLARNAPQAHTAATTAPALLPNTSGHAPTANSGGLGTQQLARELNAPLPAKAPVDVNQINFGAQPQQQQGGDFGYAPARTVQVSKGGPREAFRDVQEGTKVSEETANQIEAGQNAELEAFDNLKSAEEEAAANKRIDQRLAEQQARDITSQYEQSERERQARMDRYAAAVQEMTAEFQKDPGIDKDRWWKNQSTGDKIFNAIAAGLAGLAAGLNGQDGNWVVERIDKLVADDIEAQKEARREKSDKINAEMKLYDLARVRAGDEREADLLAKQTALGYVDAELKRMQEASQDPVRQAELEGIRAGIVQKQGEYNRQVEAAAQDKVQKRVVNERPQYATVGGPPSTKQIEAENRRLEALNKNAKLRGKAAGELTPRQKAEKVRHEEAIKAINAARAATKKVGIKDKAAYKAGYVTDTLREAQLRTEGLARGIQEAYGKSDADAEMANQLAGDPGAFFADAEERFNELERRENKRHAENMAGGGPVADRPEKPKMRKVEEE